MEVPLPSLLALILYGVISLPWFLVCVGAETSHVNIRDPHGFVRLGASDFLPDAEKRYLGYRLDLAKRLYNLDLGKRSAFNYDLGKRYNFDLGKRSAIDMANTGERSPLDKRYNFDLGKRYNFDLGKRSRAEAKRSDEEIGEGSQLDKRYNFDLGKRYNFDLGKRYNFDLGKRYNFDLGKRYNFDLGKRDELADAMQAENKGLNGFHGDSDQDEKRFAYDPEKRSSPMDGAEPAYGFDSKRARFRKRASSGNYALREVVSYLSKRPVYPWDLGARPASHKRYNFDLGKRSGFDWKRLYNFDLGR